MKRAIGLNFIPKSKNFSEMEDWQVESIAKEDEESNLEVTLLSLIYNLKSDKEKCVLLFELLRQLGFNLDYKSNAEALGIQLRWYMRIKNKVRSRLEPLSKRFE